MWYNKIISVLTALSRMLCDCYNERLWHFILSVMSWLTCRMHTKVFSFVYNLDMDWIMKPEMCLHKTQAVHDRHDTFSKLDWVLEIIWQDHSAFITQSNRFFSKVFSLYVLYVFFFFYILEFSYSMVLLLLKILQNVVSTRLMGAKF